MPHEWNTQPLLPRDLAHYQSLAGESLNFFDARIWDDYVRRIGFENCRGVYTGEQLAGGLAFYRLGQWYGGRQVPCVGLSGVAIDPAYRGTGACQAMLKSWLVEMHAEGLPMASLYASTRQLYHKVGFEQSGHRLTYAIPMTSLSAPKSNRSLPVHRITSPLPNRSENSESAGKEIYDQSSHLQLLREVSRPRNAANNGLLERTEGLWERIIAPVEGATTSTYFLGELEAPEGFIVLKHNDRSGGYPQALTAIDWCANTPAALQRMIALIVDHRSFCDRFNWIGGPQDPLLLLASEERVQTLSQIRTMNRFLNLEAAIAGRGYPSHLNCELQFSIEDDLLPSNGGRWLLRVQAGQGQLSKLENDPHSPSIALNISALMPLYTSFATCSQLVAMGFAKCEDPALIELADSIFAGPAPWTQEIF